MDVLQRNSLLSECPFALGRDGRESGIRAQGARRGSSDEIEVLLAWEGISYA
jgi:hypothetical protein